MIDTRGGQTGSLCLQGLVVKCKRGLRFWRVCRVEQRPRPEMGGAPKRKSAGQAGKCESSKRAGGRASERGQHAARSEGSTPGNNSGQSRTTRREVRATQEGWPCVAGAAHLGQAPLSLSLSLSVALPQLDIVAH